MGSTLALRIPRILAVSALGVVTGCPADDQGDTGNESGPSVTTTTGTSTTADAPTTTNATTTVAATDTGADSTSGGSDTDTGALPDCSVNQDQPACEGVTSCAWQPDYGGCVLDCAIFEDLASCNANFHCEWTGETCDYAPLE